MQIEITRDTSKMIEMAKAIVSAKQDYYTPAHLDLIRKEIVTKTDLQTPEEIEDELYKTIYYYWAYGCPAEEYYYLDFASKTHEEIKEYVTVREKVVYRNRLNRLEDAHYFNNKWDTYCLFKDHFGRDVIKIENDDDYPKFCEFISKHPEFVVKPIDMGGGNGVHKVTTDTNISEDQRKKMFRDILAENADNKKLYLRGKENGMVLEEVLVQIPEMAAVHPNSVNGVRVTTLKVGEKVHILWPWFKIGRFGQFLNSAVIGTLDACIDVETGIVNTQGCSERNERFDIHPDTGVQIVGFQIPKWKELLETVTELANKLDTVHYVGWDMVLTERGWVIMEGNFSGDWAWQFCMQRGTKKEFEEMIGWHLTKEFWWQE